tara:strand:+ start:128 stop:322 length:195 start_codon:yes stop_codon:yes gene_type:complete
MKQLAGEKKMSLSDLYDNFVEYGIATQDEILLVTHINGWNKESFNSILYARTGYRDWKQYTESE